MRLFDDLKHCARQNWLLKNQILFTLLWIFPIRVFQALCLGSSCYFPFFCRDTSVAWFALGGSRRAGKGRISNFPLSPMKILNVSLLRLQHSLFYSFSNIGPMADLMSASSSYLDKNSCYNSQVYGQNYSSHCYYGNMEYLSSGVPHPSLNVPSVSLPLHFYDNIAFSVLPLYRISLMTQRKNSIF